MIYVPPPGAAAAIWEAVEADLDLVDLHHRRHPGQGHAAGAQPHEEAKEAAGGKKTLLLGPNCPGLITPEEIKIGIMPGHIHRKGRIGVVSRSGTLTYEAVAQLTEIGLGQSSAVGIGGDPINGLKHIDIMQAFNDDPDTDAVIMIGEIGGPDEAEAARWCKANMKKPDRRLHRRRHRAGGQAHGPCRRADLRRCRHRRGQAGGHGGVRLHRDAQSVRDGASCSRPCCSHARPVRGAWYYERRCGAASIPYDAALWLVTPPPGAGALARYSPRPVCFGEWWRTRMTMLGDPVFWIGLLQIIGVNIVLSGDNAVVIALAARGLPENQRKQAVLWGSAAAVVMRILLTIVAVELLRMPYLKLVGAALLLWIAVQLLIPEDEGESHGGGGSSLMAAIRTILLADLVMSLDNVIAVAAAAKGSTVLLIIGLAISIPLVVFASRLLLTLMDRFPIIITMGAALLGWVAGDMAVTDPVDKPWVDLNAAFLHWGAPLVCAIGVVVVGKWLAARKMAKRAAPAAAAAAAAARPAPTSLKRVLLAVDGSDGSIKATRQLLTLRDDLRQREGLSVQLLNVQRPVSGDVSRFVSGQTLEDYHHERSAQALEPVRAVLDAAGLAHQDHSARGRSGPDDCRSRARAGLRHDRDGFARPGFAHRGAAGFGGTEHGRICDGTGIAGEVTPQPAKLPRSPRGLPDFRRAGICTAAR